MIENWLNNYREWEAQFKEYKVTYQKWKNDECPDN